MSDVTVVRAMDAQKPVVARLIQLYLHDMTEHLPFAVGADGLFEYDFLDRFWQHPYLTGETPCWFMAEFFVLRAYRGRGAGAAAVASVVSLHPGKWHIGTSERNVPAVGFWGKVLSPRTGQEPERRWFDGEHWLIHSLVS